MAFEIGSYLQNIDDIPLRKRLISDNKEQKAYSYFASGWMKEVEFHQITPDSKLCFLRTKCRPSQRKHDMPWSLWAAVEKQSGVVHSAFCQCFAGYSSTCNHVAALLFKIDFAWRHGLTNPACTSRECEWSAFAGKNAVDCARFQDLTWSKHQFSRQASSPRAEGSNTTTRRLFAPLSSRSMTGKSTLKSLTEEFSSTFPKASCFQFVNVTDDKQHKSS
ncbi:uncharacterized protein LOC121416564 [Lytechinus variegatus]|uniref:uncharacterized protein LOC121416564 n=1 Tax=Lytechinus variegatus TaxID=7654 RepID=UPI001BB119F1|nr:uncharacterized protein LOC121416564 [Lytechinus variegatus]